MKSMMSCPLCEVRKVWRVEEGARAVCPPEEQICRSVAVSLPSFCLSDKHPRVLYIRTRWSSHALSQLIAPADHTYSDAQTCLHSYVHPLPHTRLPTSHLAGLYLFPPPGHSPLLVWEPQRSSVEPFVALDLFTCKSALHSSACEEKPQLIFFQCHGTYTCSMLASRSWTFHHPPSYITDTQSWQ